MTFEKLVLLAKRALSAAAISLSLSAASYATLYVTDITDIDSINAIYQHQSDSSLDRLYASYNSTSDLFKFRVDFTSSATTQLGDAYFKFTNDGVKPNGNHTGDGDIPWYLFDAETETLQITNAVNSYTLGFDYFYDPSSRRGFISFSHLVTPIYDLFKADLSSTNWSGGSFTTDFGIWSHIVSLDYYTVGQDGLERTQPLQTQNWIAFDPNESLRVTTVSEAASLPVFMAGLLSLMFLNALWLRRGRDR